jgi:hypothetical protein
MTQPVTETAVTVAGQTAMTAYQEPFDNGLGELDAGDLIIPRLSITQPTTPDIDAAQVGKFCINVSGDFHDKMRVAAIKLTKSRILFPEKYKRDNDPLCRSHNFTTPADDIPTSAPMCDTCQLIPGDKKKHFCEYANWGVNAKGKPEPPKCQETWNLLIVDINTYLPCWFSVKSTSLKPVRKIMSSVSMICQAKRLGMWTLGFDIELEKVTNDSGTFYVPKCSGLSALSPDDAANMTAIRTRLVNVDIKDAVEPDAPEAPPAAPVEEEF